MQKTLPQSATLLVKLQGQDSKSIELTHETITIGRKADNSLVIEDPAVSGHHARIVKIQAVFFLEDLMSTNGTAINGRPITRHQLHDTDVITIGRHRLVFQEVPAAGTALHTPFVDLNRTMVLKRTDPTPNEPTLIATILVIAGKTDRSEYSLMKQVTCHWIARRVGYSTHRLVCPKNCRDNRPTRPQLFHQSFSEHKAPAH